MSNSWKTKEVYKDLINWKIYNYFLDTLTEFEDLGNDIDISVCIPIIDNDGKYNYAYSHIVYEYNTMSPKCADGDGVYNEFYEDDYENYMKSRRLVFVIGFLTYDLLDAFKDKIEKYMSTYRLREISSTNSYSLVYEYID